jgi:repressor of nif and glnA expression
LVPLPGALWNHKAEVELRALTAVVEQVREAKSQAKSTAGEPEFRQRRPGWAVPIVLEVLRDSDKPLSQVEVVEAANDRSNRQLGMQTVRNVLQNSSAAQSGLIRLVPGGRYGKYELDRSREAEAESATEQRRQSSAQTAEYIAAILGDSGEPLTAAELALEIRARFQVRATNDSIAWVLKRSKHARRFERVEGSHYRLAPDDESSAPISAAVR